MKDLTTMKFYTVAEVAAMVSAHPRTIQKAVRQKKLHAYKVGRDYRISEDDIVEWLKKGQNYSKENDSE